MHKDFTLLACSYNTPMITTTLLKSWAFYHDIQTKIILIDNSTDELTYKILTENNIPVIRVFGDTHGNGVNRALELCTTKYALLVDTDIIFLKSHEKLLNEFIQSKLTLMGRLEGDRGGKNIYDRIAPCHCFIDVENVKKHNITFFNMQKMKDSFSADKIYDIGSTFFEDIKNAKLGLGHIDVENNYYIHFEGMSWYKNKYDPSREDTGIDFGGTHNNGMYVEIANQKELMYQPYVKKFENINIGNKFI